MNCIKGCYRHGSWIVRWSCADYHHDLALISVYLSGIGLESSLLFAQEGAHVILADLNLESAQKGAKLIAERYPNVRAIATKTDVGKEEDVKAIVDLAIKEFGRLDVMVKCLVVVMPINNQIESNISSTMPVR